MSNQRTGIEQVKSAATDRPGDAVDPGPVNGHGRPPRPPAVSAASVVRAWRSLCATTAFGADDVVFDDAAGLVAAVIGVVNDEDPLAPEHVRARTDALHSAHHHPHLAIMQLVALGRVIHRHLDEPSGSVDDANAAAAVDQVVNSAIREVLDELERLGLIDPLTGLMNRRALDRDIVEEVRSARRRAQCLTVLMVDLDGLKATNDRFGHAAGDRRLQAAARALASGLRAGDNVYRIGGDEFVAVLPDLEPDELETVVARLSRLAPTSLSWGCAWSHEADEWPDGLDPDPPDEARRLLALADQRLLTGRAQRSDVIDLTADAVTMAGQLGAW